MAAACVAWAVAACAGCATREAMPENLSAATTPLRAVDVLPDRPQEHWYEAVEPGAWFIVRALTPVDASEISLAPGRVAPTISHDHEAKAEMVAIESGLLVRSRIFQGGSEPGRDEPLEDMRLVMARAADGSVLLVSSTEGGRTTTFDPPIVYMPPLLEPGVPFEHESQAEVVGENGRRQVGGRAVRRLEYLGDEASAGSASGVAGGGALRVVRAELDLDLFPARVVSTSTFWVDARGIVRERQVNRVWVLGVPSQTRRHDVVLREAAAPVDAGAAGPADLPAPGREP